ncbi:tRNA lysidine(34) synthetase TilS [Mesomycoplasma neurolyticum]|uniref:tRNA(Ile)-lysidine synthase n=1 Tax=Mesomycoplasma neurolyticum TaxID=2120 RepID=A0A449A5R5_9BACT|nr:tRNA lysidine(34) synthetase TilS [Mesomycoplasma neurolyticum]VEU59569.1 tRNA(Ile)-lysidine synthase [Mesomycoplasma neurolyticum]
MQKIEEKKLLLAVSGGPDSIFMLEKFKHKNIVVAHVNYNKRIDSDIDQKIVENFCRKWNIKLFILKISKTFKIYNNFQNEARKIRFNFFRKIYQKEKCDFLLLAHNKDDFFETAIMQKQKNKIVNYWGIKKNIHIWNMNVYRPFLEKYWKENIEKYLLKNNINFAIDSSNNTNKYQRNKIRIFYKKKKLCKFFYFYKFMFLNIFLKHKEKQNQKKYLRWEMKNFSINYFKKEKKQLTLLFYTLNKKFNDLNLTRQKLLSILQFIFSKNPSSEYKLKKDFYLVKKNKKLEFKTTIFSG